MKKFNEFYSRGQGLVEYAILIAVMSLIVIAGLAIFGGLIVSQMLQRTITTTILVVVKHGMALAESTASAVLPAESNSMPLRSQSGKGQCLTSRPI